MKALIMKVQFPHRFTGLRIQNDQTCKEILIDILDGLEIPLQYVLVCGMLKIVGDKAELVSQKAKVKEFFSQGATWEFKILNIPINTKVNNLHQKFQEMLFYQMYQFVTKNLYLVGDDMSDFPITLAAFKCGIEFGKFNQKKHADNFLLKVVQTIVPQICLNEWELDALEEQIFFEWQSISEEGVIENQDICMQNYINSCQQFLPQFGCFPFPCKINDKQEAVLGISQKGIHLITSKNNKILIDTTFAGTQMEWQGDILQLQTANFKKSKITFTNHSNVGNVIKFIKESVYPEEGGYDEEAAEYEKNNFAEESLEKLNTGKLPEKPVIQGAKSLSKLVPEPEKKKKKHKGAQKMFKIHYVHQFQTITTYENENVKQIMFRCLDKIEIPVDYFNCCVLLMDDKLTRKTTVLALDQKFKSFYNASNVYSFRIACLPLHVKIDQLDLKFIELLYHQVEYYIQNNLYLIDKSISDQLANLPFVLAAYKCGRDIGQFNPARHTEGFLLKIMDQIVDKQLRKEYGDEEIEEYTLEEWKVQSDKKLNEDHESIYYNYLNACEDCFPQFGSYAMLVECDKTEAVLYVNQKEITIINKKNMKQLYKATHSINIMSLEVEKDILVFTSNKQKVSVKHVQFECKTLHKLIIQIKGSLYPQEGFTDKDAEEFMTKKYYEEHPSALLEKEEEDDDDEQEPEPKQKEVVEVEEPVKEKTPEPEPVKQPEPEVQPEPVPEPKPEQQPEPTPEPVQEVVQKPEPIPEPVPEQLEIADKQLGDSQYGTVEVKISKPVVALKWKKAVKKE